MSGDDNPQRLPAPLAEHAALRRVARAVGECTPAPILFDRVSEELGALAMPNAEVRVSVSQTETTSPRDGLDVDGRRLRFGPAGLDEVDLLLSANPGAPPRPLGKGASGGELSRVMLAVEVALAATNPVPTFVFDEVDAGVGGKAADKLRCSW